ncbi:hypothetical protein V8G54_021996 [Vigna mungo]|uniref:Calmodulin binding protein C-terminal domain-containing protein n=1 Tax=Vigna mungo TaxID=3915 RepID=A0AAQ3NGQ4_VIGMU
MNKFSKTKTWDKIIEHAKECKLDPAERYLYTYRAMEPEKSVSLILNCIYELVEVIINGQPRSLRSLDSKEQVCNFISYSMCWFHCLIQLSAMNFTAYFIFLSLMIHI